MKKVVLSLVLGLAFGSLVQAQEKFGKEITEKDALMPQVLIEKMQSSEELQTKLEAKITDVCQMKGCWMTLDMGDGQEVMVRFKDYGFFVPKDIAGKTAVVQGRAFVETVPVETLKHFAEDAGKSAEEIAAIDTPEKRLSFEADGVIIK